jgi:hypothetical protein
VDQQQPRLNFESIMIPESASLLPLELDQFKRAASRFESLPNPCVVQLGGDTGPVVGVGNVDGLFHFMEEGSPNAQATGEGLSRLAGHLLLQRSFYPLAPAHPEAVVDNAQRPGLALAPVDVLLCPSRLAKFCSTVGGVLCVNPGKVCVLWCEGGRAAGG